MWKGIKCKLAALAIMIFIPSYMAPALVEAATSSARVTMSATILPASQLTLGVANGAGATARVSAGSIPATLTVAASIDSTTGTAIDPVAAATATVTDASGKALLAAPAAPAAATGQGCSASYSETFNWYLAKSWNCDTGKPAVTVTYTLTSP